MKSSKPSSKTKSMATGKGEHLRAKKASKIKISTEVSECFTGTDRNDHQNLEALLMRFAEKLLTSGKVLTIGLSDPNPPCEEPDPLESVILETVAKHFQLKVSQLKDPARIIEAVFPRQVTVYLLRKHCEYPFFRIKDIFPGREHTSLMHGVSVVEKKMHEFTGIAEAVSKIEKEIFNHKVP